MDKTARNAQCREPNRKTMQSWKAGYQETGTSGLVGGSQKPDLATGEGAGSLPNTKAVETGEGWLFVAAIVDLFSRMVVGWAMGPKEDGELVELALHMAVARRHPEAGLLHHSNRGSACTCERYQSALREIGVEVSMSRTANCWDNAAMESFFATIAKECADRTHWQTRQQARSAIFEYVECFYNPIRLHSTLQYASPLAFEQAHYEQMR